METVRKYVLKEVFDDLSGKLCLFLYVLWFLFVVFSQVGVFFR